MSEPIIPPTNTPPSASEILLDKYSAKLTELETSQKTLADKLAEKELLMDQLKKDTDELKSKNIVPPNAGGWSSFISDLDSAFKLF